MNSVLIIVLITAILLTRSIQISDDKVIKSVILRINSGNKSNIYSALIRRLPSRIGYGLITIDKHIIEEYKNDSYHSRLYNNIPSGNYLIVFDNNKHVPFSIENGNVEIKTNYKSLMDNNYYAVKSWLLLVDYYVVSQLVRRLIRM